MARPRLVLGAFAAMSLLWSAAGPLAARPSSRPAPGSADLKLVAEIPYEEGTHIEHASVGGRDYVFAATQSPRGPAELRIIEVTQPEKPKMRAVMSCGRFQGNLQVSADRRTLVLGVDGDAAPSECSPAGGEGFATIDISKPARPVALGFTAIPGGSHSTATHPRRPLVYNAPEGSPVPDRKATPVLEVFSIAKPAKPKPVGSLALPGIHSPHDISFNRDGTMAAIAAISAFHLIDTTDPLDPKVIYTGQCPGCQHSHEARFTPDGKTLVVNDESMLALAYPCPGGALYFYDLADATAPELVGTYVVDDVGATASAGFCTPHVFDISRDGRSLAASWHAGGVRLLDIQRREGHSIGTRSSGQDAVIEVAAYVKTGTDYFTAKLHKGPYVYAVDMKSGLQIFKIVRQR